MAKLQDILFGVSLSQFIGSRDKEISGIAFDSRKVQPGFLFVAITGLNSDGHDFIDDVIKRGAVAVVCEKIVNEQEGVSYVVTDHSSKALGIIASNFHDNPSRKLKLVGITGTNGKTTTATLLYELFNNLGYQVGLISTVENRIGKKTVDAKFTTPDSIALNELLAEMVAAGCSHAFMEVSSHALVQGRVSGVFFTGGVFTNISHDHLDYHKTFEAYIDAKKLLFDGLSSDSFSLVNLDDKRGRYMLQNTNADKNTFALKTIADFKAKILHNTFQGLEVDINGTNVWFKMIGKFNVYNLLAVFGSAILLGESEDEVLPEMSKLSGARGRFEYVQNERQILAIVDYAHTPDALENVLSTIDDLRTKNEQLITVVGCGGDRDREKRPKMARIAYEFSNKVIITSDNPRTEDPEAILDDMFEGIPKSGERNVIRITDRREAIKVACSFSNANDIILVAGKGHETYQEINGVRHHFDDREILNQTLNKE